MRSLISVFVNRYVASISVFGALVLFGIISYVGLGIDLFPQIEIPIVAVTTAYPGAGSEEVAQQISEPIEGTLATLAGISSVTSTSSEGFSTVIAQFNTDVNIDQAAVDVSQRVNTIVGQLPNDAQSPTVQKFDPNQEPIMSIAVSAPGIALSDVQQYVEDNIQPELQRVDGVADVSIASPTDQEIQVLLNPDQLQAYDLTADQVTQAISASALDVPLGSLSFSGTRISLTGRNTPTDLAAVQRIQVDSNRGIRVDDVAAVRDTSANLDSYSRVDGEPVVLLDILKTSGGNSVATAHNVRDSLEQLQLPDGYSTQVVNDTTIETEATVNDTLLETGIAILAVALVIMFFVGRLGTIFAVVLAIPVSIAGAFIVFGLLGFTLNLITLLAVTVAVGLVVDDSIVVAENIDRFQEMGYSNKDAVIQGAGEVSTPVLAATLSLLAVFLPISFLPGTIGDFFQQFGLAMATMVFVSYLASMFFLTMILAYVPNPFPASWRDLPKAAKMFVPDLRWLLSLWGRVWVWVIMIALGAGLYLASSRLPLPFPAYILPLFALLFPVLLFIVRYVGRLILYLLGAIFLTIYRAGDAITNAVRNLYAASLRAALGYAWAVLGLAALLLVSLVFVFPRIGFNFVPPSDSGTLSMTLELPTGTSLDRTNTVATRIENNLMSDPLVEEVQTTVGAGDQDAGTNASPERATFTVDLGDARDRTTDELAVVFQERLDQALANIPEADLSVTSGDGGGPPTGSPFELNLASNDLDILREREPQIRAALQDNANLRNLDSSLAATVTERVFQIDEASLVGTGLTPAAIYQTLRTYNVGSDAGNLRSEGNDFPIVVEMNPRFIGDEQSLLNLPISAPALQSTLPLGQFGSFQTQDAPSIINRANRAYSLDFTADLAPGSPDSLTVQNNIEAALRDQGLIDERVSVASTTGLDLLGDLVFYGPVAFALALLLNYLVIGTQFNSFKFPLYLLLTVPLALVGALWLMFAVGASLDIISVLGVIMLIGLVTKNAILLLEVLTEQINEQGGKVPSLKEALVEAGKLRFRPILMTTSTVVIISLPLLLGLGEGGEFRFGLGLVILGGVVTSALLTFYVVPAAFYQLERKNFEEGAGGSGERSKEERERREPRGRTVVITPRPSSTD